MSFFTLHVRLTRDCNAHCSYCSSAGMNAGRMSPEDFRKAIDFISDKVFPRLFADKKPFLTIEYLGGEVLLVPQEELVKNVAYARQKFARQTNHIRDGAQSNLIASPRRVVQLHDLFDGNLGTSWDNHSGQRHIKGSPELYKGILDRSLKALEGARGHLPGRVLVMDKHTLPHISQEVKDAIAGRYDLVLRPIFEGGSGPVEAASSEELSKVMGEAFALWAENPAVRIEPFYSLYKRRMANRGHGDHGHHKKAHAGCPFQSDCAFKSLSLDPDGSLYVCQEMADSGNYPLGNAIEGTFEEKTWRLLSRRSAHLSADCSSCTWREECGGGCMNEAIQHHGDPFAKTELCPVWKTIFRGIDAEISKGNELMEVSL
jgi:radical SAM protein with 4Fe4S-binding SPASM domain